jgi:hypothetical protein
MYQWDIQRRLYFSRVIAEVPQLFDEVCWVMSRPPCHFVLKEEAVPVKICGSRPVSKPIRVPFTTNCQTRNNPESTTARSYALHTRGSCRLKKKHGGIRFCPDYHNLIKFLICSKFDNPMPFQSVVNPKEMNYLRLWIH